LQQGDTESNFNSYLQLKSSSLQVEACSLDTLLLKENYMYTHIWLKYLPIIKILMKRSATGDQTLDLNRIDFERAGTGRKAGYKFTIEFTNGRVANVISNSPLAPDLATVLLQDDVVKTLVSTNNFQVSLNTRFQLSIKNCSTQSTAKDAIESGKEKSVSETE
jgi:hypothetical protein